MSATRITSKEELLARISDCSREAPHVVPLLMASYSGKISLACLARGATAPLAVLNRAEAPAVILYGDDYADGFDIGPASWPGMPRVARWARAVVINATGGVREHYETFVAMAVEHRRLVVIETGTARVNAWLAICRAVEVPTLLIKPESGGVQPAVSNRELVH